MIAPDRLSFVQANEVERLASEHGRCVVFRQRDGRLAIRWADDAHPSAGRCVYISHRGAAPVADLAEARA